MGILSLNVFVLGRKLNIQHTNCLIAVIEETIEFLGERRCRKLTIEFILFARRTLVKFLQQSSIIINKPRNGIMFVISSRLSTQIMFNFCHSFFDIIVVCFRSFYLNALLKENKNRRFFISFLLPKFEYCWSKWFVTTQNETSFQWDFVWYGFC